MRKPGQLVVGLYAWILAVAFGAIFIDIVYAARIPGGPIVVPARRATSC